MTRDELLRRLAETHRPVSEPYPPGAGETSRLRVVQCRACSGNGWKVVDPDVDEPVECELWRAAVSLGVIA